MLRILFVSSILFLGTFGPVTAKEATINAELNKTYERFSEAFTSLNSELVKEIYAKDACYIPAGQNKQITQGRHNILSIYQSFFKRIRHKNAQIEVDFRVLSRQLTDASATDVGYYLIRFHPAKDTEEPISEFAGKFVTVSNKDTDGKWYLTVETSNKAEPNFYYDAKPIAQLYYGKHFKPLVQH